METSEFAVIEEAKAEAAKALDTMIAKAGKANGIVSKGSFIVTVTDEGSQVQLHGSALAKVGTGYVAAGDTGVDKIWRLVDQIAEALGLGKAAEQPARATVWTNAPVPGPENDVVLVEDLGGSEGSKEDSNLEDIEVEDDVVATAPAKPKPAGRPKGSKNAKKAK